jgi:hypothetical protein
MITGQFHQGSGLGNQLHRYVATRVLALDKGFDFSMLNPELFKGKSFMNLDMGVESKHDKEFVEKKVVENGIDIRGYDPEFNFIEDNTLIEGEFQDERYFNHRLPEIREWLKVEPLDLPDDLCVINFRGGEYVGISDLFLPNQYWLNAIVEIQKINPDMRFEVHTDDVETASKVFQNIPIVHDIALNWRSIRYAKYLILSNSSFAILPALLNEEVKMIIAPRYWARHNIGVWALPQNYYSKFKYI